MLYILKVLITAVMVVAIAEVGKRSSFLGGIIASLPLTSILAMIWLHIDTKDNGQVIALSYGIFWAVIPSLFFFIALPILLKSGLRFGFAMPLACAVMALAYAGYVLILKKFGVSF